jgi:23S rRNA (guanine745-N1)-methyltransferase
MLADVLDILACPVCGETFTLAGASARCANGHAFDVARGGYVNLAPGSGIIGTGDTPDMVRARVRFLGAGHYRPIAGAVVQTVLAEQRGGSTGAVVDAGAGTGYYLAGVLDALPSRPGVALDASKHAARVAAKAHPRVGAIVCDTWKRLPLRDSVAAVVLDIFAPRNASEMRRVLRPEGMLVVATPTSHHLRELVTTLGMVTIDAGKDERLEGQLSGLFEATSVRECRYEMVLTHDDVTDLVAMGPSARHLDSSQIAERVSALPERVTVSVSVRIAAYRPV